MSEIDILKKKEIKSVKSFGLSSEAISKIDLLSAKHSIPKSQLVENLILNFTQKSFEYEWSIYVKAISKQGARIGRYTAYKDPAVSAFEYAVKQACKKWWAAKEPLVGPVRGDITFVHVAPKTSTVGYNRKDLDNMAKAFLDAIKTVVVGDDSQFVELKLAKEYGDKDEIIFKFESCEMSPRWQKAGKKYKWK